MSTNQTHQKINEIPPNQENKSPSEQDKRIEEQEKIIKEYTETLKRLQAEFENFMKRTAKEKEEISNTSRYYLLLKFLNVFDDLERAVHHKNSGKEELLNGLKFTHKNFEKILKEEGIKQIAAIGKKVDPYFHEVIKHQESSEEEGTIIGEIQKGYTIHDFILRPSKVIISNGGKKNE